MRDLVETVLFKNSEEKRQKLKMAMRILSSRFLSSNLSTRVLVTPSSQMSTEVSKKKPEKRTESFLSYISLFINGKMDHKDPDKEPIPAQDIKMPHSVEHATGEHKLLLLAFEQGIIDPYCNLPVERNGAGTRDNPIKVESFTNERTVGCICEENQNHLKYTILNKGEPKRCLCGHWLELVEAPKFWTKIPKEDLLTIPYFMDLEAEGKLDRLLAGEDIDDHHHGSHHAAH